MSFHKREVLTENLRGPPDWKEKFCKKQMPQILSLAAAEDIVLW